MILPLDLNSVGAPYDTPIICPAQPPRILSSSSARVIVRGPGGAGALPAKHQDTGSYEPRGHQEKRP